MARPPLDIDATEVEKLASLGCKTEEIATFFDCSRDTIERRFAANLAKGRDQLRISLRKWQIESARKGNVTMLIWLGKQMLGQSDKAESDYTLDPKASEPLTTEEALAMVKQVREALKK